MQLHKNEITTGILVLGTLIFLIAILICVAIPGVVKPINTYRVYFDNANGIRPGNLVLLGGREIGKVSKLQSPVPSKDRPAGHPEDEVLIEVQVDRNAQIFQNTTVHLTQQGIMGQEIIDFVHGDEGSPLATNHSDFIGDRIPDVAEAFTTAARQLTGEGSDMSMTIKNLNHLTADNSNLAMTIKNLNHLTEALDSPKITQIIDNFSQMSDTLKREPWRLAWPSTKAYNKDEGSKRKNEQHER